MKQSSRRAALLVAAMLACTAQTAHAGLISWLDALSGPGPFYVFDVSHGLKCWPGKSTQGSENEKAPADQEPARTTGERIMSGISHGCQSTRPLDERFTTWSVGAGVGFATQNPLHYDDQQHHDVWMLRATTSLDYRVHRALDVGAGVGMMYFNVPHEDSFSRPYVEP